MSQPQKACLWAATQDIQPKCKRLPDPRTLQTCTPQTGWVQVKAGAYRIGASGELDDQIVKTGQLWIRTWPVTVAEYQAFVAAGGNEPGEWFAQQHWPNRPVVEVSWFQASAFCAWAQKAWVLPEAGVVDLPTSMEWEMAMRRGTGRTYPWGDALPANGNQSQAAYDWEHQPFEERRGAPVGAFPLGHTPEQGLEETVKDKMRRQANNKVRQANENMPQTDDKSRVLRGGSWGSYAGGMQTAWRNGGHPSYPHLSLGFRVLLRVPKP